MFRSIRSFLAALAVLGLGATSTSAQLVRSTATTTTTSFTATATPTPTATVTASTSVLNQAAGFTLERGVPVVAPPCDEAKLDEIFQVARPGRNNTVTVDCSFTFSAPYRERITKQLLFTGNTRGVTVDCRGGAIDGGPGTHLYDSERGANIVEIRSSYVDDDKPLLWTGRPQDITIRDCEIIGSARIWPVDLWLERNMKRWADLSREPGYVATLRANAPRGVRFEHVTFRGQKKELLVVGPGVTETEVVDSKFLGEAQGVILYLDAESSRSVIRDNVFDADPGDNREILAIDGSDHNRIIGNYFSQLDQGGIYLYRNCGEGIEGKVRGVVRFTTPSHNQIINNVFYYNRYDGDKPAIALGSRNGKDDAYGKTKSYCDDDADFLGGSGADDRSFATHNVVMQNQFYKRSVANSVVNPYEYVDLLNLLSSPYENVNVPNFVAYNEGDLLSHQERPSGCFVDSAYGQFLRDGETTRLLRSSTGAPICRSGKSRCDDGKLVVDPASLVSCQIDRVPFACRVSGNNGGCSDSKICPSGTKLVRTVAACNLEYGAVTTDQLAAIPGNDLRVVRASDRVSDGSCHAGSASISSGEAVIERESSGGRVYFGCSEHDENGGDCHVSGELYCQNEQRLTTGSLGTGVDLSISGSR